MTAITPSQTLRVVGQEFEKNKIEDFELEFESGGCHVRATLPPKPVEAPPPAARHWSLKSLFTPAPPPTPQVPVEPEPEIWEHTYTWSDLEELDRQHQRERSTSGRVPDDYSTSHVLRVVGAYVERQHWALAGIARTRQIIEIRHRRPDGQVEAVSQRFAELYDFSIRLSQSRRRDLDSPQ